MPGANPSRWAAVLKITGMIKYTENSAYFIKTKPFSQPSFRAVKRRADQRSVVGVSNRRKAKGRMLSLWIFGGRFRGGLGCNSNWCQTGVYLAKALLCLFIFIRPINGDGNDRKFIAVWLQPTVKEV